MIYYIVYTLSIIPIWGLLLLDIDRPDLGILIGLIYTYYSSFLIQSFVKEETNVLKVIKVIGPTFYFLVSLCVMPWNLYFVFNPIGIAFFIFVITLLDKNNIPTKEVQFFILFFIYIYSFVLYSKWDEHSNALIEELSKYDFELAEGGVEEKTIPRLEYYNFLNVRLDTVNIESKGKYTIIETWNEKCPPCLKAIPEMREFYTQIKTQANQYYVYIPAKKNNLNYKKVFSFEIIGDKEQILVDINLQQDANLEGYPTFLVFNPNGELVFKKIGYNPDEKEQFQKELQAVIH